MVAYVFVLSCKAALNRVEQRLCALQPSFSSPEAPFPKQQDVKPQAVSAEATQGGERRPDSRRGTGVLPLRASRVTLPAQRRAQRRPASLVGVKGQGKGRPRARSPKGDNRPKVATRH